MPRFLRYSILSALAAGLLLVAPIGRASAAEQHSSTLLQLYVTYAYDGSITVTTPTGQTVGVKTGTPTVIPAGYYTIELEQPGCVDTPAFILQGPNVNLQDDLESGEIVTDAQEVDFQPNSTYLWRDGSINPPQPLTFVTSSDVIGTQPAPSAALPVWTSKNAEANGSVVGSASPTVPSKGTLAAAIGATGTLSVAFKGKSVTSLQAGRYKVAVTDASKSSGLVLVSPTHKSKTVTTTAFVGKHAQTFTLTAGTWSFAAGAKKTVIRVAK